MWGARTPLERVDRISPLFVCGPGLRTPPDGARKERPEWLTAPQAPSPRVATKECGRLRSSTEAPAREFVRRKGLRWGACK